MATPGSSSATGGILSSPRAQRRLLWGSGGVLMIGLIVFLAAFALRGSSGIHAKISTIPAQHSTPPVKAKPDPKAYNVARKFIATAVLRKHLSTAYNLVGPDIKGGMSLKQWDKGNIPVMGYPAGNVKTAGFTVVSSYKKELTLLVDLVARPGTDVRPHLPFWIRLDRFHGKTNGRWLVNYWLPDWEPPVPSSGG